MGPWFEGGQMPLQRRLPKRGFRSLFRVEYAPVNVADLVKAFAPGEVVDLQTVKGKGLVPRRAERWKVLGQGDVESALTVQADGCSVTARQKIEAAGGTVTVPKLKASRGKLQPQARQDT